MLVDASAARETVHAGPLVQHAHAGVDEKVKESGPLLPLARTVVAAEPRSRFRHVPLSGRVHDRLVAAAHHERDHVAYGTDILDEVAVGSPEERHRLGPT